MQLSITSDQFSSEITALARRFTRLYSNRPPPEGVEDENQDEDREDLENDEVDEDENGKTSEVLKELLASTCAVVRNAHSDPSHHDLDVIDKQADELLQRMIECAYGAHESIDFLPSFAHDISGNSLIEDPETKGAGSIAPGTMREFIKLMTRYVGPLTAETAAFPGVIREPYSQTLKPHDKTSPIARFKRDVPGSIVTEATPTAQAIYQGRCSAMSSNTCIPIGLSLSHNSTCMTLSAAGGWKNRRPVLSYYVLDDNLDDFPHEVDIDTGLADLVRYVQIDAQRKTIYAADNDRVKSWVYDIDGSGKGHLAKHTLNSMKGGPLALIDDGRKILRGGRGGVEVWDVDSLPDHGPKGKKRVGKGKISVDDFWHDEPEDIERSTGTDATLTVKFADPALDPLRWQRLSDAKFLCTQRRGFSCYTIDLQAGGKVTSRYLGHGGEVNCISVSEADPNAFLTACNDGVVRLYDVREPLPRLSFNAGAGSDPCDTALYIHVEGVPFIISGGHKLESIKVWDPRARAIVYELATGNNSVNSLAWDASCATLYAATECQYMDRLGRNYDYRPARIRSSLKPRSHNEGQISEDEDAVMDEDDEDEDEDEDEDDDGDFDDGNEDERYWPSRAQHDEDSFGYAFDSGDHALFSYRFGVDADPKVLPVYGQAVSDSFD